MQNLCFIPEISLCTAHTEVLHNSHSLEITNAIAMENTRNLHRGADDRNSSSCFVCRMIWRTYGAGIVPHERWTGSQNR